MSNETIELGTLANKLARSQGVKPSVLTGAGRGEINAGDGVAFGDEVMSTAAINSALPFLDGRSGVEPVHKRRREE